MCISENTIEPLLKGHSDDQPTHLERLVVDVNLDIKV